MLRCKKKVVSSVLIVLGLLLLATWTVHAADLSNDCTVEYGVCSAGRQEIFSISDNPNGHASFQAGTYGWKVCCQGTDLGTSSQACSSDQSIFRMTASQNAQVEYNWLSNPFYSSYACLGNNGFNCTYSSGSCTSPLKCVVSISAASNAHVGDCTQYPLKVCCGDISSFPGSCSEEAEACGSGQSCCTGLGLYCSSGYCCPTGEQWNGTGCDLSINYPSFITGTVTHTVAGANLPVDQARVTVLGGSLPAGGFWAHTDAAGDYLIGVYGDTLYDVVASKQFHEPNVTNTYVNDGETKLVDFHLQYSSSTCTSSCTRFNDICDSACAFWNGCFYQNDAVRQLCDGKQKGQIVEIAGNSYQCCTGQLVTPSNLEPELEVTGDVSDIVTVTRTVLYQGKPVKIKINIYNKK